MNQLDIALTARAFGAGRAVRSAALRHRRLVSNPLTIVLWQLGGEPFSAAAAGFGSNENDLQLVVAGDPRNRDLAFAALLRLATWFNKRFESPASRRDHIQRGQKVVTRAQSAPQILVANEATVEMLGRLGRRLAYLPLDGEKPASPELVRLGQHLLFLHRHSRTAGQQLVLALTDFLARHWATPQSAMEKLSLGAFDAYVAPPPGTEGFYAAAEMERDTVGPIPAAEDDQKLDPLVTQFNRRRGGSTDKAIVKRLLAPIENHYRSLVEGTWQHIWKCRDREAAWPEAPSVARRWEADLDAYTQHIDWTMQDGRTRTRQTSRQAAIRLQALEDAKARLSAEEACDDPVKMVPYILENKAVQGRVIRVNADHSELATARMVRRPLVTILSPDPCLIPRGKELWWTLSSDGRSYIVEDVRPAPNGGSIVTLKLTTGSSTAPLPKLNTIACFSVHSTGKPWYVSLSASEPWSHRPAAPPPGPQPIEGEL